MPARLPAWLPATREANLLASVGLFLLAFEERDVGAHLLQFGRRFGGLLLKYEPGGHLVFEREPRLGELLADFALRDGRCAQRVGFLAVLPRRDEREARGGQRGRRAQREHDAEQQHGQRRAAPRRQGIGASGQPVGLPVLVSFGHWTSV